MRVLLITMLIMFVLPSYAYAWEWSDLQKPEILAPLLAILLGISELLGAIDVIKPNGIIQSIINIVAGAVKKLLGKE